MAKCPLCNANIPDDFGLVDCPNCAVQLMVHMDGRVEHAGAKVSGDTGGDIRTEVMEEALQTFEFASPTELEIPEGEPDLETTHMSAHIGAPAPAVAEPQPEPVAAPEPEPEIYQATPAPQDSPDLSDIARFGNSEASGGREGSLRYTLLITGIDTADVREAFREAITDRKLVWDTDEILRSVKNGKVRIPNISPPKAFILVSRLRDLPVQVRWEQNALSQI